MDIAMPELNGIEAVVKICECCPETRVVMLSVYATSEHVYRALKAGALGYVVKESAGQEVAEAVRAVHAGRRYLSPRVTEKVEADFVHQRGELPAKSPLESLSEREREVLQLVVEGWSSAEIAAKIFLSPKSVETYRSRIMLKLGVHDLPGLIRFAIQHGMTTAE
jgi:DNA-binding NarL/FixJ family response regulator